MPPIYTTALVQYDGAVAGKSGLGTNGYPGLISASVFDTWESDLGKRAAVVHINQRRMNSGSSYTFNTDHKPPLDNIWNSGRIPFVTFGYWDLGTRTNNGNLFSLARIAAGNDDAWLTTWAQQAAAWGHPFWWRIFWEFNALNGWQTGGTDSGGNTLVGDFPWAVGAMRDGNAGGSSVTWTNWAPILGGTNPADGSTTSDLVRAIRHIDAVLQANGATNVNIVWCPNNQANTGKTDPVSSTGPLTDYWPGNRADGSPIVALIAPDGYCKGDSGTLGTTGKASMYQIFRGGAGTALRDTWANIMACDTSGKIPFGISETNCYLVSGITQAIRQQYMAQALETDIPQLNADCGGRLAVVSWFWWQNAGSSNHGALDLDLTSPSAGNSVFNLANVDFVAFKTGYSSTYYVDNASGIALPTGPQLRPYWLTDQTDRFRKGVHSTGPSIASPWLVGYFRGVEASGNLADDSASALVATAAGTPAYAQASVVPSNPTDGSVGFAGAVTTGFSIPDSPALSPATTGAFSWEEPFVCTALPVTNNGILFGKGNTGQFEYDAVIAASNGGPNMTMRNLANTISADAHTNVAIPLNVPLLWQATWDGTTLILVVSSATGGAWGDICNVSSGFAAANAADGTAALMLGLRALAGDHGLTGREGHWQFYNAKLSTSALKEHYNNWLAAPVISGITVPSPSSAAANIDWATDVGASSAVDYGPTAAYGLTSGLIDPALVTTHSVGLSGLHPAQTYHYRVRSRNVAGAESLSADATFTTPGSVVRAMAMLGSAGEQGFPEATYAI